MMSKMRFAAVYLGLGLLLAACNGGDGDGGTAPTTAELTGKWLLREIATKGQMTMKVPAMGIDTTQSFDTTETYSGSTYYMDFKADNTYESNMPDVEMDDGGLGKRGVELETGTWSLDGKVLTTVSNPDKDTAKVNVTLDGSNLTAKFSMDTTESDSGVTMSMKIDMTAKLVK